jgi:hypothetical protein
MKTIFPFLFYSIFSLILFSCANSEVDPAIPCNNFEMKSVFINTDGHADLTGDTINSTVQFLKDSVSYEIISPNVNVPLRKPIVTKNALNVFITAPFDLSRISDNETIFLIYHLNSFVRDTVTLNIVGKTDIKIYNKGILLSHLITFNKCDESIYVQR